MKKIIIILVVLSSISFIAFSQSNKIFFDKSGKATAESQAYYYRVSTEKPNNYKAFYISDNTLYFEGVITSPDNTNEAKNIYGETCIWYYRNGQKKAVKSFNSEGKENGVCYQYYENGRISKEEEFRNGKLANNKFKEYSEDGQVSRIFEEFFHDNSNDWDTYSSNKSYASISNDKLEIVSMIDEGTARFINFPIESNEFVIEAIVNNSKCKSNYRGGIIWGFKDWQNYNYYLIANSSYYIGTIYEGILASKVSDYFTGDIKEKASNNLKIISNGDKIFFSINGSVQHKTDAFRNYGSKIGFAINGKSSFIIEKLLVKEISFKNSESISNNDMDVKATGSGLLISRDGYILTNFHVVDGKNKIYVEQHINGQEKQYSAVIMQKDVDNDLALIKITDANFNTEPIPYSFKESGNIDVGASVFTIGYPFALGGMGKEVKFTDGKISSKTGFNNALNMFQTSIPVQAGNSGGPVFTDKGQLIGIINAKLKGLDNVSYSIKLNYIKNLIELVPESITIPNNQNIINLSLEEKIKSISNFVVLIKIK